MSEDLLDWMVRWYVAHCDGDWEHSYGITIDTLDNPGWMIQVAMTDHRDRVFERVRWDHGEDDWLDAQMEGDDLLSIACSPHNLRRALELARATVDPPS